MKNPSRLVKNTFLLTGSALVMRCIAMAFQVWLVGRIGSDGIGLFQLVMSVSMLCTTFAISGIRFAATRLISEELGLGRGDGVGMAMRRCLSYGAVFGMAAFALLWLFAKPIGFLWIGDARTVYPLRLLSFSLPFISLSSVISGYFTASGRVYKSALVQVSEQLVKIALVAVFLSASPAGDIEKACSAVVAGGTAAEVFSLILITLIYILDRRVHKKQGGSSKGMTVRMFSIAIPLAFSAYARTSLSTIEHLLVPRGLKASGMSPGSALSGYGVVHGMVFPIITFPSCFLLALAETLVPELTEAQVSGRTDYISHTVSRLIEKCLMFAIAAATLLFTYADELGNLIYSSPETGRYIKIFAILTPVIYMDMVTDGCLKGLGQHMHSMAYNIWDAAISVMLVYTILPRYALTGYIFIICFTECFNFILSIRRLAKISHLRLNISGILLPLLCSLAAVQSMKLLENTIGFLLPSSIFSMILTICSCSALYILLLRLCGISIKSKTEA